MIHRRGTGKTTPLKKLHLGNSHFVIQDKFQEFFEPKPDRLKCEYFWSSLLVFVWLFFFLLRSLTFSAPMDRDEGEYAYGAHCLLQGLLPYESFYSMKWPGIFLCYSLIFSVFGENGEAVRVGLAILQGLNSLLIFWLGKMWISTRVGFFSALFFLLLSFLPCFDGFHANAEFFVLFPSLLGILILNRGILRNSRSLVVLAGFFFGSALMIKQHAFGYLLFSLLYASCSNNSRGGHKRLTILLSFMIGVSVPFLATSLLYWIRGTFDLFLFWTVHYARCYVSLLDWDQGWMILKERLAEIKIQAGWCFCFIGFSMLSWKRNRKIPLWIWILLGCTVLTLFPGFYFRQHYFLMCLPPLALLAAVGCETIFILLENSISGFRKIILGTLFAALFGWAIFQGARWEKGADGDRFWGAFRDVAQFIKERALPGDSIAYLGSEPQIFFYSGLPNVTHFLYAYPLMEPQPWALAMQNEMIRTVENKKPRFLLFHFSQPALGVTEFSEKKVFFWFNEYQKRYKEILRVEFSNTSSILFRTGKSLEKNQQPESDWLRVYERISL